MDTDSFINALRRFIARRGNVNLIRSDNGSNFVGASNELKKALNEMDRQRIEEFLTQKGAEITWKWNPPTGSHMGGVWERQIRSVRTILNSLMLRHGHLLDDEGLSTLMCEVEAIINSRPLTTETLNDSNSCVPLSPAQLLTQKYHVILPPPGSFDHADLYCRRRWKRIQQLANEFWSKWQKGYLNSLQKRQKWNSPTRNFRKNDIVLLKDESRSRNHWPLGRITGTLPDKSGLVRQVELLTKLNSDDKNPSIYKRPISKLILLVESQDIED